MIKVIEGNLSVANEIIVDFQMRTFEYESFEKLIDDFESNKPIYPKNCSMEGKLRPANSTILYSEIKDDFHVNYVIEHGDRKTKTMFYMEGDVK